MWNFCNKTFLSIENVDKENVEQRQTASEESVIYSMPYTYITGFRGSLKLKIGDYSFTRNKESRNKVYWSCARAGTHRCKARAVTIVTNGVDTHKVIMKCAKHNHPPF